MAAATQPRRVSCGLFPGQPVPRLYDRTIEVLRVLHYSRRTEEAYVDWIRRYIEFHFERGAVTVREAKADKDRVTTMPRAVFRRRPLTRSTLGGCALTPLQERLDLMLQLRNPPPQLGVLRLQFGNPLVTRVVHDPRCLNRIADPGKRNCLTVTSDQRCTEYMCPLDALHLN